MTEPVNSSARSMIWLYAGALLVEALALVALWLISNFFG